MTIVRVKKSRAAELAGELRGYIRRGALGADAPIASARELALQFQAPLSTMNRAVGQLVDEGLLYRRHGSGTFVKGAEKTAKCWRIGFYDLVDARPLSPESNITFDLYERMLLDEFGKYNCEVSRSGFHDLRSEERCRSVFPEFDAIFVSAALLDVQTMKNLYNFNGPIVIFNGMSIFDFPAIQVLSDWSVGIRQMLEKIDTAKFRKFLLLCTCNQGTRSAILGSFRQQAVYFGISEEQIEEQQIHPNPSFSEQLAGYKFGMNIEPDEETFIFCLSDFMAFGILDAWRERGIPAGKYPLVGCFNMEEHGSRPFGEPLVTSINHDKEELVRRGVELLISALEKEDYCPKIIKVPGRLVVRRSAFTKS
mgnify:CR=1 FL=1|jgi:DNA-binding LacI/PurR family transcriptional regulator